MGGLRAQARAGVAEDTLQPSCPLREHSPHSHQLSSASRTGGVSNVGLPHSSTTTVDFARAVFQLLREH